MVVNIAPTKNAQWLKENKLLSLFIAQFFCELLSKSETCCHWTQYSFAQGSQRVFAGYFKWANFCIQGPETPNEIRVPLKSTNMGQLLFIKDSCLLPWMSLFVLTLFTLTLSPAHLSLVILDSWPKNFVIAQGMK